MSVRKTLPLPAAGWRLVAANLLLVSLYNPSSLSAVAVIRSPEVPASLRAAVAAAYAAALLALGRQAWCGFRALGALTSGLLLLALAALLWSARDALLATPDRAFLGGLLVASVLLGTGQVAAYYARQFSGQSPVLKQPP
jgi:uncharacterized membrane protein YedE/YeeE